MIFEKKILGVITARGGSKGLPGKNIKLLNGKPLIVYTIEAARESRLITDLIVSTDSEEIAGICREHGAEVPFIQPAELATDTSGHLEVMQYATKFMEEQKSTAYDYVVIFQPTSPFRTVDDIDKTIEKIIEHNADSAFSMCAVEPSQHPIKVKKMEGDTVLPYCMEEMIGTHRQDFPKAYKRSGAVYVTGRDILMKENKLFGDFIVGHIVPAERSIDIDTEYDWVLAEYKYKKLKEQGFFGKTA
ncbi:MAG: acylneuraminate cytidylyltransferase family protein [Candidatus Paceibacterota bacterium]|jgi:N-acylneuraminate cytidylyltransferase/CMP-N,N'-diacetyllegionaminic acid synthase